LPVPCGVASYHNMLWISDMELQDLMFALLDFSLILTLSFLPILLFLRLGMGVLTQCHCMLGVCNLFVFTGAHS
jgi:hypothetical protein